MGQQQSNISDHRLIQQQSTIPLWEYDEQKHAWKPKESKKYSSGCSWEKFRVLTYNIWFSDKYQPMRFQSLCDILSKSNAQIIGLQEMTKHVLQQLLEQPFIQQRYYISDVDGRTFNGWYGVVLLIDLHLFISNVNVFSFPQSNMGRRLLLADIKLDENELLRIGTVHLESLNSRQERQNQLQIAQNIFNYTPATCILMGDFNFNAHQQENIEQFKALPNWIDVWARLMGTQNPGFTYDTEANAMTKANNESIDRSRIDRIILKSQTIIPTEIEILGTKPIGNIGQLNIHPSDHFGLTAVFERIK